MRKRIRKQKVTLSPKLSNDILDKLEKRSNELKDPVSNKLQYASDDLFQVPIGI